MTHDVQSAVPQPYPGTENDVNLLQGVSCCPHCGQSEEGYYYGLTLRYRQHRGFTNNPADDESGMDDAVAVRCTQFRCGGCDKIIKSVWPKPGMPDQDVVIEE